MSTVSVVIPTYNGARFVCQALTSVFAQTLKPREIIVVDDCSSDDTSTIVEELISSSPAPLRLIQLPRNSGGPARPVNVGIREASGELIAVLDQDDVYAPDILKRAADALTRAPQCSLAFYWAGDSEKPIRGPRQSETQRSKLVGMGMDQGGFLVIPGPPLLVELLTVSNFVVGYPGFMFRRRQWQAKGGVDESLRLGSDMELIGWLLQHGDAALLPRIGYYRREHDSNACRNALLMHSEIAVVTSHLLRTSRCLNAYPEAIAQIRSNLRGLAYRFRQAQQYSESARVYWLLHEVGDSCIVTVAALAKLSIHCVLKTILRRGPEYTAYMRPTHPRASCSDSAPHLTGQAWSHTAGNCAGRDAQLANAEHN
jgi:hypothetical protein